MTCGSYLTDQLHARGFRMTPQRMAILHTLRHAGGHLSPTEVYEQTRRDQPNLTETTVYRTLEFLAEQGLLLAGRDADGRLCFELAARDHHHLVCRECGAAVEVEHAAVADVYRELETRSGFALTSGHLTLVGLCPKCRAEKE